MATTFEPQHDPREHWILAGFNSENAGVQSVTQSLAAFMFATNQRGPRIRPPSLSDHALYWKKDRSTVARWLKAAEAEGAIRKHNDGSVELVLAPDSPR